MSDNEEDKGGNVRSHLCRLVKKWILAIQGHTIHDDAREGRAFDVFLDRLATKEALQQLDRAQAIIARVPELLYAKIASLDGKSPLARRRSRRLAGRLRPPQPAPIGWRE